MRDRDDSTVVLGEMVVAPRWAPSTRPGMIRVLARNNDSDAK